MSPRTRATTCDCIAARAGFSVRRSWFLAGRDRNPHKDAADAVGVGSHSGRWHRDRCEECQFRVYRFNSRINATNTS